MKAYIKEQEVEVVRSIHRYDREIEIRHDLFVTLDDGTSRFICSESDDVTLPLLKYIAEKINRGFDWSL